MGQYGNRSHREERGRLGILDVLGPTVEFPTMPDQADAANCIVIGGAFRTVEALIHHENRPEWATVETGELVDVPGGVKHAFRSVAAEPVVELIVTTPRLGRFFQ